MFKTSYRSKCLRIDSRGGWHCWCIRLNPEHKYCFKRMCCFNLHSFSEHFRVHESVMYPLTLIIKYIFSWFCVHFLTCHVHYDVNSQDTKFGWTIFKCYTDKHVPESKPVLIKTCFKQNRCSGFSRLCLNPFQIFVLIFDRLTNGKLLSCLLSIQIEGNFLKKIDILCLNPFLRKL